MPIQHRDFLLRIYQSKALAWGLIVFGILLRFIPYLDDRSLWLDESRLALNIINRSFSELLEPLDRYQLAPAGFLFIEKLIVELFGNHEYTLRLFPFLCGVISILLFYKIAKTICGRQITPIALTLFSISSYLIRYSSELKQYSSDVALTLWVYLYAIHLPSRNLSLPQIAGIALVGAVSVWISHPSAFVLAGIGTTWIVLSLMKKERVQFFQFFGICLIWLLSFAVMYFVSVPNASVVEMQGAWQGNFEKNTPILFLKIFRSPLGFPLNGIAAFAFVCGSFSLYSRNKQFYGFLILPLAITFIVSAFHLYPFHGRLLLFLVPALLMVIAEGIYFIFKITANAYSMNRHFIWIGIVFFVLLAGHPLKKAAFSVLTFDIHKEIPVEEIKPVIRYLKKNRHPGDIIYLHVGSQDAFRYYAERFGFTEGDYYRGIYSEYDWTKYIEEMDKFHGNKRVWLLFSNIPESDKKFFLSYLDSVGKRLDSFKSRGAAVYLYDLSR